MTQRGSFFDSTAGDRIYDSATMARSLDALVSDGVIDNEGAELIVTESTPQAMTVKVGLGLAMVRGYYFEVYSSAEVLTIAAAHASLARIDRVVIRRDLANRQIVLAVLTGTPAASPVAPALTQVAAGTWEHALAQIAVPAASTSVINSRITDQRAFAATQIGSILDPAIGHDHDGVDSKTIGYGLLTGVPATFAPTTHTHSGAAGSGGTISYAALTSVPATFAPAAHAHGVGSPEGQIAYVSISGVPTTFAPVAHAHASGSTAGQVPYANLTGIPATFAPTAHAASHKTGGGDAIKASEIGGFDRKAAGGTVGTQIFVGTTTPTGAAEGDIWIKA